MFTCLMFVCSLSLPVLLLQSALDQRSARSSQTGEHRLHVAQHQLPREDLPAEVAVQSGNIFHCLVFYLW